MKNLEHDKWLEMRVLSALLNVETYAMIETLVEKGVTGADFFTPAYGAVFELLVERWKKKLPMDGTSVVQALCDCELLPSIGGLHGYIRIRECLLKETVRKAQFMKFLKEKRKEDAAAGAAVMRAPARTLLDGLAELGKEVEQ